MGLTRDFKQTIVERVQRDPLFAQALFDEALTLMLTGEPETARMILRDLINSTLGFETLAERTDRPAKSLHRMFSARGNPSMDNLTSVVGSLRDWLNLSIEVRSTRVAPKRSTGSAASQKRRVPALAKTPAH